jgi:WD40 repeat protein
VVVLMGGYEDGKSRLPHEMHMDRQVQLPPPALPLLSRGNMVNMVVVDASAISVLEGHTNCIWSLAVPGTQQPLLASAAADYTVKIWDTRTHSRSPLRASFKHPSNDEEEKWNPTCVSWDWEGRGVIIGWENANVEMWDVEQGTSTMKLISTDSAGTSHL